MFDRLFSLACPLRLRDGGQAFAFDQALPACSPHGDQPAVVDHAAHAVDADTEHLGRLPKAIARHYRQNPSRSQLTPPITSTRANPLRGPPSPVGSPPPSRPTVTRP